MERQRLSRELHDSLGQDLSGLKIGLDTAFDGWPDVPPEILQKISQLSEVVHRSIKEVRDLAFDLGHLTLDQSDLNQALSRYCQDFSERTGIGVDFFAPGIENLELDFDTRVAIFRLIQEAITNVRKHAHSQNVAIRLAASYPKIILRIEDDGQGFDIESRLMSALNGKHMGIKGMKDRVSSLKGKMRITSSFMKGTRILIEIPYSGEKW
jgi:signal transduction histidine kinase